MPSNKDFKRLVRGRMQKTGESYTAARATLLRKPRRAAPAPRPAEPVSVPPAPDYARIAGMSDAALEAKTGCTWDKWVMSLDYVKAYDWSHREIAGYLHEKYKVPEWWTQMVTVGYERIKGLREIGQRRGGSFEANRSKTIPVPVARVYRAFTDARLRKRWIPGIKLTVRTARPNKSVRITWADDTSVEVWLTPKGEAKTATAVAHRKLGSKDDVARLKAYWGERLDVLHGILTS